MRNLRWTALLFVLALVVACGDGEAVDPTTVDTAPPTTETTPPATDPPTETTAGTDTTAPPDTTAPGDGTSVAADDCEYGGTIESIEAVDPLTVEFNLCNPFPAFQQVVAFTPFGIQPAEHLEETGGSPLENPIGTGPFVLDTWNRGDSVVFSANQDYWGDVPAFDQLVFRWGTESAQRLLELQSGTVDVITNLATGDIEAVEGDPNLQLLPVTNPNVFYLGIANTQEPFDNPDVRRALAIGIDRQQIVDSFYPAGSEVPGYFTPCSIENACEGDPWPEFDPEAARALLAEAGYPDGFETTISFRDVFRVYLPEPGAVANELAQQLSDNLGITAQVELVESGQFIEESSVAAYPLYLLGWGADYPHVTNFMDFHFGGVNEQFGDIDPSISEPLLEAATIADPATAAPLYAEASAAIQDLVPMVPIAHGAAAGAALTTVEGAEPWPVFGAPQFERMNPGKESLVFMQNAEPISLYCADESDGESLSACQQVLEPLLEYDLEGNVVPAVATECTPNEAADQWTCTLREGVQFHGEFGELEASDVVASWAAGIDAANPLHTGNTGTFYYYAYLWGSLMNAPPAEG